MLLTPGFFWALSLESLIAWTWFWARSQYCLGQAFSPSGSCAHLQQEWAQWRALRLLQSCTFRTLLRGPTAVKKPHFGGGGAGWPEWPHLHAHSEGLSGCWDPWNPAAGSWPLLIQTALWLWLLLKATSLEKVHYIDHDPLLTLGRLTRFPQSKSHCCWPCCSLPVSCSVQ